jgi:hypothetical protein
MLRRLAFAAMRANPLLTLGVALELAYRLSRGLRRSTPKGRCMTRPRLVETTLKPRTGRGGGPGAQWRVCALSRKRRNSASADRV